MKNSELNKQKKRLDSLFEKAVVFSKDTDLEGLAEWTRYLCILVAGFVENSLIEIYSEFIRKSSSGPINRYALKNLQKIQNPKSSRFYEVIGSFDPKWREDVEKYFGDNGRSDAIDAVMDNRHKIAHGKGVQSNISFNRLKSYYERCIEAIDFVEKQTGL